MSLQHLTLGERIVMASRVAAAEHLRQDADSAGINVRRLQREAEIARTNNARAAFSRGEGEYRSEYWPRKSKRKSKPVAGGDDRRAA